MDNVPILIIMFKDILFKTLNDKITVPWLINIFMIEEDIQCNDHVFDTV